jgi:hypothetical protein
MKSEVKVRQPNLRTVTPYGDFLQGLFNLSTQILGECFQLGRTCCFQNLYPFKIIINHVNTLRASTLQMKRSR